MAGFLSAAAVAAWAVSIVGVGPIVLVAWIRSGRRDRWLILLAVILPLMLVGFLAGLRDLAGLVDLRAEGLGREWDEWLWGVAGAVILGDALLRGGRSPRLERDFALFLGTYALGYLFQQLAMVAANGRPW